MTLRLQEVPPGSFSVNGQVVPGRAKAEEAVRTLLQWMGQDPARPGLLDTPRRVVDAFTEMTIGYAQDPTKILATTFEEQYDELILLRGIRFTSLCEHHILPFTGTADVGYIPSNTGKVIGLSKLARLVECYARRLQVQERMTVEIAEALMIHLKPQGVAVVVKARHSCMGCRGVKKPEAIMVTSSMTGVFRDSPEARAEFLALCRDRSSG
jgi:GTP cyclohydrolase IA